MRRFFKLDQYTNPLQRQQAIYVVSILLLIMLIYSVYYAVFPYTRDGTSLLRLHLTQQSVSGFAITGIFYALSFFTLYQVRAKHVQFASWLALTSWAILSIGNVYATGLMTGFSVIALFFSIVIGALLLGRSGLIVGAIVTTFGISLSVMLRPLTLAQDYVRTYQSVLNNSWVDLIELLFGIFTFSILILRFLEYINFALKVSVNEAIQVRADVGDIVTELTQRVAKRVTVAELSNYTIERVLVDFPKIYHAQIFLMDENGTEARLFASTGAVGKKLIERAHGLKVGSVSVIGQVTYLGKYIIAKSGSRDTVHQRNELLPETQVEAAFPLRIGDRVIGALDLQSKERDTFDREDLAQAFQTLADSIGLAIDNIRQYDRAEQRLQENQRLVEETREALRQVERLNQRLTGRIWTDYIGGAGYEIGASVDFEADKKLTQAELTASLKEAIENQQLVQTTTDEGRQIITVPLRVRGRVVGAMEFELDEDDPFTPDDLDLLNEVSDRFGAAVENVRLVNESQRTAQREALVNQIVGRLQTMNNVEDMVTEAAKGLRDALKANKIAIKLGTPPR